MRFRRPARSLDLHQHLSTFVVCAAATVVLTRALLAATGYPQVGGSKFHIAHVLYGGLLLTAATIALLAFLSPATKAVTAMLGGIGFGLFIDEVGKFVTKDVNYFYRPAIAIIYVCFIALFAVIRVLGRGRFTAHEATLIGIEALERSASGSLSDARRARVLALLDQAGVDGELGHTVRALVERCTVEQEHASMPLRLSQRLGSIWDVLIAHPFFRKAVFALLAIAAAISAAEVGWLLRHGTGHLAFSQRAFALTTLVADCALLVGALRLRHSLLGALEWYERAVLIEITLGQVFLYTSEQLAATLSLVALLLLWALLRWAIHYEQGKHALARAATPAPAAPLTAVAPGASPSP